MAHPYFRVHVCQASYGDCLALEIDDACPVDPMNYLRTLYNERSGQGAQDGSAANTAADYKRMITSPTRRVMLLDGGPALHGSTGFLITTRSPLQTTHDDADHMNGIFQLLVNMHKAKFNLAELYKLGQQGGSVLDFTYVKGAEAAAKRELVAKNIWHNSADNVVKLKGLTIELNLEAQVWCSNNIPSGTIPTFTTEGYFDKYRGLLGYPILPDFNAEWKAQPVSIDIASAGNNPVVLIADTATSLGARAVQATNKQRGHVNFEFIGPTYDLLQALGDRYYPIGKNGGRIEKKPQGKTLSKSPIKNISMGPLAVSQQQQLKAIHHQSTNIAKKLTNDPSVKNKSSLTFNAQTHNSQSVFLGDATAADSFLRTWDGKPKNITVMKVMHHGSLSNNWWPQDSVEDHVNRSNDTTIKDDYMKYLQDREAWEDSVRSHNKDNPDIELILSEQRKVSLFFDNVRAQKYIISASHVVHPNPHISTLVGIIARAVRFPDRVTGRPVDIYLTNLLSNDTWLTLATFWGCIRNVLAETIPEVFQAAAEQVELGKWDPMGSFYRLWTLRPSQSFGTVLIDPDCDDLANYQWVRATTSDENFITWHHEFYSPPAPFSCLPTQGGAAVGSDDTKKQVPGVMNKKITTGKGPLDSRKNGISKRAGQGGKNGKNPKKGEKSDEPRGFRLPDPSLESTLSDPSLTRKDDKIMEELLLMTYNGYLQNSEAYIRNTNTVFQPGGSLDPMIQLLRNYSLLQQPGPNNGQLGNGHNQLNFNGGFPHQGNMPHFGNTSNQGNGNNFNFGPGGGIPYPYTIHQLGGNPSTFYNHISGNHFFSPGGGTLPTVSNRGSGGIFGAPSNQQQQPNYSLFSQSNTTPFNSLMMNPPCELISSVAFEHPQKMSISPEIQQPRWVLIYQNGSRKFAATTQEPMIMPNAGSKEDSGNALTLGQNELSSGIYYSVPWETLNKFNLVGDELDYYPLIMPKLKTIKSLDGLFTELVRVKLSTASNVEIFKQSYKLLGGPLISNFASFVLGGLSGAKPLLQCLPVSIPSDTTAWMDQLKNPYCSQIDPDSVVSAFVDGRTDPSLTSPISGPQQIKFTIKPPSDAGLTWLVPNTSGFLGKVGLDIFIAEGIDITIYWPTVPDNRVIYGTFKGVLRNMGNRNVVCEFLVMPDERVTPTQYSFQFADENFQTKGYTMNLIDIAEVFAAATLGIYLDVDEVDLPGLESIQPLVDTIKELKLVEPGFTLQKDSPYNQDIQLRNVFGTFEITTKEVWAPFGDLIKFNSPKVKLTIDNLTSPQERQVMLNIYERMEISGFPVPLAFETKKSITGARIYRLKFAPEDDHPVTVLDIFKLLSLSMLDKNELPDCLADGLEALSLRSFTPGWGSSPTAGGQQSAQKFSAVPSFLELVINFGSVDIINGALDVTNALVRLQVFNPGDQKLRKVAIASSAAIDIAGVPTNTRFRYGGPPIPPPITDPFLNKSPEEPGISFAIACKDTPLTFHDILNSLVAEPPTLPGWLDDTITDIGLESFSIETVKDVNGKQLVRSLAVDISLSQETIHICDGIDMKDPHLEIVAKYPGDASRRLVMFKFNTEMQIGNNTTMLQIGCSFGTEKAMVLHIDAGDGVPVGQLISHFASKFAASLDFELPSALDGFKTITLGETLIVFDDQNNDSKLSLASIDFSVFSGFSLVLWDEPKVELTNFELVYSYAKDTAIDVTFKSSLQLGTALLSTVLTYDKVISSSDKKDTAGQALVPGTYFTVAASYDQKISLFDIVKSLSGIDLASKFKSAGIDKLKEFVNIQVWEVELSLAKTPQYSRVAFGADTNWLIFQSIKISATNQAGWGFSVGFSLKDDVLNLIPIVKEVLGKFITLTNTEVALFIKDLDPLVFPKISGMAMTPSWAKNGNGSGLAVSTKLSLNTKELGILGEWIGKAELDILGVITEQSLSLSATIDTLSLFENSIQVQGSILVSYSKTSGTFIGVDGQFSFDIPVVSKQKIKGQAQFGVNLQDFGLSFKVNIPGPLQDLFDVKGLQASDFVVQAVFPPGQEMVPNHIEFSGKISIQSLNDVKGSLQVRWIEKDPSNCYLSASIENLNLSKILAIFASDVSVPSAITDVIKNTGIDVKKLALEIVPKDMPSVDGKQAKKQGIRFEGNLSIVLAGSDTWSAYSFIDISKSKFVVLAMMSPIKPIPEADQIFSIGRDNSSGQPDPSLRISADNKSNVSQDMQKNGPIFQISTEDTATPVFISGQLVIFGIKRAIRVEVKKDGFSIDQDLSIPTGDGVKLKATCLFKSKLALSGTITVSAFPVVSLPLNFINSIAGTKLTSPVNGSVTFSMNIGWSKATAGFKLTLSGSLTTFGKKWDIASFDVTANPQDVDSIGGVAKKVAEEFASQAGSLISNFVKDLHLDEAVKFVSDGFKDVVENKDIVQFISDVKEITSPQEIGNIAKSLVSIGNLDNNSASALLRDLGLPPTVAGRVLGDGFGGAVGSLLIPGPGDPPFALPGFPSGSPGGPDIPGFSGLPQIPGMLGFGFEPLARPNNSHEPVRTEYATLKDLGLEARERERARKQDIEAQNLNNLYKEGKIGLSQFQLRQMQLKKETCNTKYEQDRRDLDDAVKNRKMTYQEYEVAMGNVEDKNEFSMAAIDVDFQVQQGHINAAEADRRLEEVQAKIKLKRSIQEAKAAEQMKRSGGVSSQESEVVRRQRQAELEAKAMRERHQAELEAKATREKQQADLEAEVMRRQRQVDLDFEEQRANLQLQIQEQMKITSAVLNGKMSRGDADQELSRLRNKAEQIMKRRETMMGLITLLREGKIDPGEFDRRSKENEANMKQMEQKEESKEQGISPQRHERGIGAINEGTEQAEQEPQQQAKPIIGRRLRGLDLDDLM
ncbi:hypothetical protein TWF718_007689 [Orbilia javanica]|uniref:Uncharacterized protein n=1 Tax=Orbilia javanica TaxID=47235 RepID=A0AAN8MNI9_9PEZI